APIGPSNRRRFPPPPQIDRTGYFQESPIAAYLRANEVFVKLAADSRYDQAARAYPAASAPIQQRAGHNIHTRLNNSSNDVNGAFDELLESLNPVSSAHAASGSHSTPDGFTYGNKVRSQMAARGFTPAQIDEAVRSGDRIEAINKATGGSATPYINPTTGQSVVIDNATHEVIQVGGPGFKFGPQSGDVPGAQLRPAPPTDTAPEIPEVPGLPPGIIVPELPE
ncbi:MAG: colicin E5-related ribonuclease, partial [Acetobacteraceae bacterium]